MRPSAYGEYEALKDGAFQTLNVYYGAGLATAIPASDIKMGSFVIDEKATSVSGPTIGDVNAAEMRFTIDNTDGTYDGVQFDGAPISAYIEWNCEHNGSDVVDSMILFYGYVDSVIKKRHAIEVVALDICAQLDRIHDFSQFPFSSRFLTVYDIAEICTGQAGYVPLEDPYPLLATATKSMQIMPHVSTVSGQAVYGDPFPAEATYRQILGWCCELMACCARAKTSQMKIQLVMYDSPLSDYQDIAPSDRYSSEISSKAIVTTGVAITIGEDRTLFGSEGYVYEIVDNPLVDEENIQTIGQTLQSLLVGQTFYPFSAQIRNMPYYQPFDKLYYIDIDDPEVSYPIFVTNTTIMLNHGVSIAGAGEQTDGKPTSTQGGSSVTVSEDDFVVARSISSSVGKWSYLRYRSGAVELWGRFAVRATDSSQTSGSTTYHSDILSVPLPFVVNNGVLAGSADNQHFIINPSFDTTSATKSVKFRLGRGLPISTSGDTTVQLIVRGNI